MKGEVEELFEAFVFSIGDRVRSKSNPEVASVVVGRMIADRSDWKPLYLVNHIRSDGTPMTTLAFEFEIRSA